MRHGSGDVSIGDIEVLWKEYLANPDVMAIRKTLVDMRKANILFTGNEFARLINRVAIPGLEGKDWKSAIIVEKPHQYGVSRQFQVFAECYNKNAIFYEYDSALQWLRQQ